MSSNYFDDMSAAVEEDELDEDELGDLDDDDEVVDDDGDSLSDGVSHSQKSSYDMVDIEEYQGPSLNEKSRTMDVKKEKKLPAYQEDYSNDFQDDFSSNNDISLSNFREPRKVKNQNKGNNKIMLIVLGVIAGIIVIAGLVVFSMYQRDSAPVVREVHIESDNFEDHSIAEYGTMITLTFVFNKELEEKPRVIIMGREVEVFGDGDSYFAKYFVLDQGTDDQIVTFSIKDYKSSFKKSGPPITTTTDNSQVVIVKYNYS